VVTEKPSRPGHFDATTVEYWQVGSAAARKLARRGERVAEPWDPAGSIRPVVSRYGFFLGAAEADPDDDTLVYPLRGPWRDGQVRLHAVAGSGEPRYRLELEIEVPIADEETGSSGLPFIIDPEAVVRLAALTCQQACDAFFEARPALTGVLDPETSGLYVRQVDPGGITRTVALTLLCGCDVLAAAGASGVPDAAELLCAVLVAIQRETPYLEGPPNRAERRRRGPRRR
jgi:hypothetical protein